jgi:hypothetical protein
VISAYRQWTQRGSRVGLVEECADLDASFQQLADAAEIRTPYGIAFRYPGDASEPQPSEAREAVVCAGRVLDQVGQALVRRPGNHRADERKG